MKKKPPKCCYPDCFNCPYADCRYDRLESEDFEPDQMEDVPESVLKARTRARKYENSHKEENRERSRKWYAENKERDKERAKKWNHENKARIAARRRKNWSENPEKYRKKQRDYRARAKDQLPKCDECSQCTKIHCERLEDGFRRLCVVDMRLVRNTILTSPEWCRKRKEAVVDGERNEAF